MIFILLVITSAIILAYSYFGRKTGKGEPPTLPGKLPIIGHALEISSSSKMLDFVTSSSKFSLENDGVSEFQITTFKTYVLTDPEDCATVANIAYDKSEIYDFGKQLFGNALFLAPVPQWKHNRRHISKAFNQKILDGYINVFNSQSKKLIQKMAVEAGKGPFDHYPYLEHSSLETVCQTVLGTITDVSNIIEVDDYLKAVIQYHENLIERSSLMIPFYVDAIYNMSPLKKRQDKVVDFLNNSTNKVIQFRKNNMEKNAIDDNDSIRFKSLSEILMKLESEGIISEDQVRHELSGFIAAGYTTSAIALFNTILLLGSHPEVQEKVYKEIIEFIETDRDVTKNDLNNLVYLDAVIKESLRVRTITPIISRALTEDVKIRNYTLRAGYDCCISLIGLHSHPMWGEDRHEFKPERWLDPARLPKNPTAFSPFSIGRRGCIGKTFSQMSTKITLANFLRHYKVEGDITKVKSKYQVVIIPESAPHLSIEKRMKT